MNFYQQAKISFATLFPFLLPIVSAYVVMYIDWEEKALVNILFPWTNFLFPEQHEYLALESYKDNNFYYYTFPSQIGIHIHSWAHS